MLRCRLSRMNRSSLSTFTLAVAFSLSCTLGASLAQDAGKTDLQPEGVALTELSRPAYPPLGRQARISGDVDLMLHIRNDGSIESLVVVSGHPLLAQTALDSAQHSHFECRKCGEAAMPFRLVYTFQLVEPKSCCDATDDALKKSHPDEQIPGVTQSLNHVTVVAQSACICDPVGIEVKYKVRSLKCLYLWRCGTPRVRIYE